MPSKLKNISWELAIPKLGDFPIDKLYIGSQLNQLIYILIDHDILNSISFKSFLIPDQLQSE